jgi:integrase
MVRHRKDYRVTARPATLVGTPGSLTVNFLDERGELTRSFDFSVHASQPVLAAELALAFRQHHAGSVAGTSAGAFRSVGMWFLFLDGYHTDIVAMRQVDGEVVRAFIVWLDRNISGKGNRYAAWSGLKQLFVWLLRNRPELTHPALDIPFNPFPRKNAETQPRAALKHAEIEAVLTAARSDIDASWAIFSEGKRALAAVDRIAVAAESDIKRLDLNDLGTFLAVIIDRFAGIIPSHREIYDRKLWPFLYALQHHGGTYRISQYLYPVPETLIPYMIAIGAQTYANAEALRHLRRDCMSEHMLLDGRVVVSWRKGRATREQRRSFLRDRSLSVPNLIDRVLEMTARLVPHVSPGERDRLFLNAGIQGAAREIKLVPDYLVSAHVRRFVERHKLRDSSGGKLPLTMACLRPTGLTLAHASLGYDIFKTQALANHATPDTTQRYVDRPIVRKAQAAALGRLQLCFVEAVRSGGEPDRVGETIAGIDAGHATASGFLCRDPASGIGENQKPGRLCTAWLGCFTCPNAVIPLDPDILARLLRTREALVNARAGMVPDRWRLLYAPKLEIIDRDIVPRFPLTLQEAAVARVGAMPPSLPIE